MPDKTIFERFNTRFSRDILVNLGEKPATRAMRIWERADLPEPSPREYNFNGSIISVPLPKHGISFVFRSKSRNPLMHDIYEGSLTRNDHLLQPLYRRILDDTACFEIRPGIKRVHPHPSDLEKLKAHLKEAGLKIHSQQDGIFGVLPSPGRDLVVANAIAVKKKGKAQHEETATPRQSLVYSELADYIRNAFVSASSTRIGEALRLCRDIASKPEGDAGKILYDVWAKGKTENDQDAGPTLIISP